MISKAVAAHVTDQLRKEISGLREKVVELKGQVDLLEQYSRRNCLRIGPAPEKSKGDTDEIVKILAKSNEDLTKTRAEVAAKAGQLNRDGKVDDTLIRDGFIFVKKWLFRQNHHTARN